MSVSPIRGESQNFPITYVIIGVVALVPVILVPAVFMFAGRYHRRHPPSPLGGTPRDILLGESPKIFEVHVKPGLEAGEARFEDILVSLDLLHSIHWTGNQCIPSRWPFV
jgi:hypothetical protein